MMPDTTFHPVAPRGLNIDGSNASEFAESDLLNCMVTSNLKMSLTTCDSVIITGGRFLKPLTNKIFEAVTKELKEKKKIYFLLKTTQEIKNNLQKIAAAFEDKMAYIMS